MKLNSAQNKPTNGWHLTLQVSDDDLIVVGSCKQVMGLGWEAHRSDVAAVWPVRLNHASASDVIQHTGAVLLPCCQQTSARVNRDWCHRAACHITHNRITWPNIHSDKSLHFYIKTWNCKCKDNIYVVNSTILNHLVTSLKDKMLKEMLKLTWAMKGRPYHSYTARYPQVPKTHRLILRARCDHPTPPRVERKDMTWNHRQIKRLRCILFARTWNACYPFRSLCVILYPCVHSARADPVLFGSPLCRCYSLQHQRWLKWLLRFQDPP